MSEVIIDVREKDEFEARHIPGSISIPLSEFEKRAPSILAKLNQDQITVMCLSGKRSQLAMQQIKGFGLEAQKYVVYEGGINKWSEEGKPVARVKSNHLPILRQVHIIAGGVVMAASLAAYFIYPEASFVAAFFGAGLFVAGATGFCGMAMLLAKMPWNNRVKNISEEVCIANTGTGGCSNT